MYICIYIYIYVCMCSVLCGFVIFVSGVLLFLLSVSF